MIFSNTVIVIASNRYSDFAVLQSSLHEAWVREHSSTLETRQRYALSDCYETFPSPAHQDIAGGIGKDYFEFRRTLMRKKGEGLTKIYNRLHDSEDRSEDTRKLRDLHVEIDRAAAAAYGWQDLHLGHDFHQTKQGVRFTISESARREVLARLLKLNHERYSEEVKRGLDEKKGKAKKLSTSQGRKKAASTGGASLFDDCDEDKPPPAKLGEEWSRQIEEQASPQRQSTNSTPMTSWQRSAKQPEAGAGSNGTSC
jgi:hypothetical protein